MALLPRTTVLSLLLSAGPAVGQAALSPGRTLRLESSEPPPTFQAMWDSTDSKPAVSLRLPDDYTAEGTFPLFVHLEGGHGGNGANLGVPLQVTQGKGYVVANFRLFKRLEPDPANGWTIAVGADDAGKIGPAYRTSLEKLNSLIPKLDPGRSIPGGHSNCAHTVAALPSREPPILTTPPPRGIDRLPMVARTETATGTAAIARAYSEQPAPRTSFVIPER